MKPNQKPMRRRRSLTAICSAAFLFQLGGCEFGEITTTVTLNGRDVLVSLFREAILGPVDAYVTGAIDNFFDDDDD